MYVTGDSFQMQAGAGEQKGTHFYVTILGVFLPLPWSWGFKNFRFVERKRFQVLRKIERGIFVVLCLGCSLPLEIVNTFETFSKYDWGNYISW